MNLYRITKYNPEYRDVSGKYLLDEWTSIHDIGKTYNGKTFRDNEYIFVENAYIKAIEMILKQYKIETMYVNGLEKYNDIEYITDFIAEYPQYYSDDLISIFRTVKEGGIFNTENVLAVCRLILREHFWCNIHSFDSRLKIHFGYDYYMKVECNELNEKLISDIVDLGLFVELC